MMIQIFIYRIYRYYILIDLALCALEAQQILAAHDIAESVIEFQAIIYGLKRRNVSIQLAMKMLLN
ncbi:MAG: hypothetical protein ABIN01_23560 [Ferruginibacter sp.]